MHDARARTSPAGRGPGATSHTGRRAGAARSGIGIGRSAGGDVVLRVPGRIRYSDGVPWQELLHSIARHQCISALPSCHGQGRGPLVSFEACMGLKLKLCPSCGQRKKIGGSKRRCKACRRADPSNVRPTESPPKCKQPKATRPPGQQKQSLRPPRPPRGLRYADYLQTEWWKWRRQRTLKLAGYQCQRCARKGLLQVHHKTYERLGNERDADLEAVCGFCHERQHESLIAAEAHLDAICGQ